MAFTYNNKSIEKVIYKGKQVNITQFKGTTILEDNCINGYWFYGNDAISSLNEELIEEINFTSNSITFTKIKITPTYLYYVNDTEETPVYSYTNNSWASSYRTISISSKKFVSTKFYDWFNVNFIRQSTVIEPN